jgi:CheY-like chemotaxis protein
MVAYERTGHTILVVEDDIFVRLDIAEYLRDCGYRVIEAGTAAEAIDVLESNVPIDLVFSDIQMPGEMDGFGLAHWIRQHQPGVKTILTSGYIKAAEKAGELCDDGPIAKPYDHQLVVERIRQNLGFVRQRRAADG